MGIFQRKEKRGTIDEFFAALVNFRPYNLYSESKALKLSAVYRCVNVISDSIACLPLNTFVYEGDWKKKVYGNLWNLLNISPNGLISAFTFKKMMVQYMLLQGNAYILITRDKNNNIQRLDLLNSNLIEPEFDNQANKILYKNLSNGSYFPAENIIHVLNYTTNGLKGESTLSYAGEVLEINYYTEQHTKGYFEGGANLAGILRPTSTLGNISSQKAKEAKQKFIDALNADLGGRPNGVVALDSGWEYQPISVNPKDSQLLESREFNFISIAQFFGVPLSKLFVNKMNKYNTVEAEQVDFLNSTLQPIIEKIEIEFYRKLYLPSEYQNTDLKFDVRNLLRMDSNAQADYYTKMFQIAGKTPNEIRAELDADFPVQGGNRAFISQNVQPIDNILNDIKAEEIKNKMNNGKGA